MEKGKLYRVDSYAYESETEVQSQVEWGGWLWLWEGEKVEGIIRGGETDTLYLCRSVSTGEEHQFFEDELEAVDAGEG